MPRSLPTTLLAFTLGGFTLPTMADRTALADDGREVLLRDDGSWEYISTDRMATSEDGTRVRLKDDGSWEFIGNAPMVSEQEVRTESLEIRLDRIVTEVMREKSGPKSEFYSSQTVFYLAVDVSSYGEGVTPDFSDFGMIEARDNRGTEYPVIAIDTPADTLEPGVAVEVGIRVDGSPSGSLLIGAKKITLKIDRDVFRSAEHLEFSEHTSEIKKVDVDSLPEA